MKTSSQNPSYTRRFFNLFLTIGLLALLFGPVSPAAAQAGEPSVPLFPQLTWLDQGGTERAFTVNDDLVTLSGTEYRAAESFDLEASPELSAYYSSAGLAEAGWQKVSSTALENGVISVYFHPAGVYAVVDFAGCEVEAGGTCLTVWQSGPTDIVPVPSERAQPQAVGTLTKSSPSNGATGVDTTVTISWNAYTGTDLNRYRYCIDTSNNSTCDASGNWTNAWSNRSVKVTLQPNTKYYWQVEAVLDDNSKVGANSGDWWSFTTKGSSNQPPGIFGKVLPANGATGQSITPTLVWQASANATSYEYCIDTVNNNICDSNWVSTNTTFVTVMTGLGANITYYWQVRALNSVGVMYANGNSASGVWVSFRTAVGPGNDTADSAFTLGIPYENVEVTTAATLDTGTTNACSPALGLASVWYKYTPPANRRLYMDTLGTNYDTFIAVWTRNINGTLSLVVCNDNAAGTAQSNLHLSVVSGATYYIQVAQKNAGSATVATPGGTLRFHVRSFADVFGNNVFWKNIEGLYAAGITGGCGTSPDLLYCPAAFVDRASMAVFLLKGIKGSGYVPPAVGGTTGFTDVPVTHWAAAWIKQLAAEGITSGCGASVYCPEGLVNRAQMSIFLLRSKHNAAYVPPAVGGSTGFSDVATSYWAAAWIKQLAAEGITSGCGPTTFCPEGVVTREQMAAFLSRTFGVTPKP